MYYFTTFFDKNYLSRGLVLYDSLKEHCEEPFDLFILCLDDFCQEYFQKNKSKYPEVVIVSLDQIERADPQLAECKNNRSKIEYYFTLSPCLPLFLLKKFELDHICSLDADILFFSNPAPIFGYLNNYSIIVTPHKFSQEIKELEKYGLFNVSFQIFKNDEAGLDCLKQWRIQCIDWCCDYLDEENQRFADQKYLDSWVNKNIKVLDDEVSGLAPWNINNYEISLKQGKILSNDKRVVFYHFHHFKLLNNNWASNGFNLYKAENQSGIDSLYYIYWKKLRKKNKVLMIINDYSIRKSKANKLITNMLNERSLYYLMFGKFLFKINTSIIPEALKSKIKKKYA